MNNSKKIMSFRRGLAGFVIFCMIISMQTFTAFASSNVTNTSQYEKILKAQDDVEEAKKALKEAEDKFESGELPEEDLENIGWEFIDHMVEVAYEKDKEKLDPSDMVSLSKLTIQGNIDKAKTVSSCKSAINKYNNTKTASKTFKGRLKRALSVKNINKAIDIVEKCNKLRKKRGLKPYKISPYLMAGAAVSALITFKNGSHSYPHSRKFTTVDGTKVSESYAWGYKDPFYIWYTVERNRAAAGQGGTSHFRAIINTGYKQTGASWYDKKNLASQCFTKSSAGTSYTPSEFRELFEEYIEQRKEEVEDAKNALLTGDKEPEYLIKAREDLEKAQKKLKKAYKAYVPTFTAVNYNYRTVKVKFTIPEEYSGIEIYRSEVGATDGFELIKKAKKGKYIYDSDKVPGVTLYYKIRFYKKIDGETVHSKYSEVLSATPKPSIVREIKVKTTKSTGKIKLSWLSLHGVSGYQIYARMAGEKSFKRLKAGEEINGLTLNEAEDPTKAKAVVIASKSGTYQFKIRAYSEVEGTKVFGTFSAVTKAAV